MCLRIKVDEKSLKEEVPYPDATFPFSGWLDVYNCFADNTVNAHWHHDFECGCVLAGSVDYYINNTYLKLHAGDCVFVNSNMVHMSKLPNGRDNAVMFTITFSPALLTTNSNSTVYKKYFSPITDTQLEGFKTSPDDPLGLEMANLMMGFLTIPIPAPPDFVETAIPSSYLKYFGFTFDPERNVFRVSLIDPVFQDIAARINEGAMKASGIGYELESIKLVIQILLVTQRLIIENKSNLLWHTDNMSSIERARAILAFIHLHYSEKITVDGIASYLAISRGECFRCFKNYTGKSLIEYIIDYRLLRAAELLRITEKSITEIFSECGFENASYFSRAFKKKFEMSPTQYRKIKLQT